MLIDKLQAVYNLLEDELSKKIFISKLDSYFGCELETDFLYDIYDTSRIIELENYSKDVLYVICGAGNFGRKTLKALKHAGYKVACFLDNDIDKQGNKIDGYDVMSFSKFVMSNISKKCVAIKGAENTLKKHKPKLAISLYHKKRDIYEIPLWLCRVVPEYKFFLRHYSNKEWDMVLYCIA